MFGYLSLDITCSSKLTETETETNCSLLGTDNVRGQLSEHISAPNGGYYLYISLQIKAISKFFIKGHVAALVRSHINGLKPFDRTIKQTTETMVLAPKQ